MGKGASVLAAQFQLKSDMRQRLVIFDFDGTIADTFDVFLDTFDETAAMYQFCPFDRRNIDYLRTLDAYSVLKYHCVPMWKLPMIARTSRNLMSRHLHKAGIFEGIETAITTLRSQGMTLALVTSNSKANVVDILKAEMVAAFDYMECNISVFGKRAALRKLLSWSRARASDAIFIGDELRDAHAAADVGIRFGAVSWGYTKVQTLIQCGAHDHFDSPGDLLLKLSP